MQLPASKSISNRALIISALARRESGAAATDDVDNVSDCDDSRVVVRALEQCASRRGSDEAPHVVDIMAAGTAMRFLTVYFAVTPGTRILTGTERMRHRPIAVLVDALRRLGADIEYEGEEGFPPLRIRGRRLEGGALSIPGEVSSQYVSALMMAAPVMAEGLTLHLEGNIVSRPYIDMTMSMMRTFGAAVRWDGESTVRIEPQGYVPVPYVVENDWSAASYWYELVALAGEELRLPGLRSNSLQGDSRVSDFFEELGVSTEYTAEGVTIRRRETTEHADRPLVLDLVEQPDLAQTLVCTCAFMGRAFRFTGLQSLKIKETDRIHALRTELGKMGFDIGEEDGSVLFWDGQSRTSRTGGQAAVPIAIDTYDDHRMAMAFAPACVTYGQITINNPEVVTKSYPGYWKQWNA